MRFVRKKNVTEKSEMAEKTQATMLSFFTKKAPIDGEITNEVVDNFDVPNMEDLNICHANQNWVLLTQILRYCQGNL